MLLSALLLTSLLVAQDGPALRVADFAPDIKVAKWFKGEPVSKFEPGTVYVVEFWATWCGPCIQVMPHLTALQKKHPGVRVVAVAVSDTVPAIDKFLKENDAKMGYTVGIEEGRTMSVTWMENSGQSGIPVAYIVGKDGKIEWIGHSAAIDGPLEKVLAGTWDRQAAATEFAKQFEKASTTNLSAQADDAYYSGDYPKAVELADQLLKEGDDSGYQRKAESLIRLGEGQGALAVIYEAEKKGSYKAMTPLWRYQASVLAGRDVEARRLGEKIVAEENAVTAGIFAWNIVDPEIKYPKRDLELAMKAVRKALDHDRSASALRTLAYVYWHMGDKGKAVDAHNKAVNLMRNEKTKEKWTEEFRRLTGS